MSTSISAAVSSPMEGQKTRGFQDSIVTPDAFKSAFRNHAGGVAVITADIGDGPVGLTATSVISVSVEPPLVVFSVSELSSSTPTITQADTVVVHLLGADQLEIAKLCATSGIDRFADTSLWTRLQTGEPLFHSAHAWIRGKVVSTMAAGGSTVIAIQALQAMSPDPADPADAAASSERPLVYHNRTWHVLSEHSKL
ncbi:flavin reductase family protein [Salinibacterium sp. ZJ454]|uniref:flavin reductase family protein n=1 Tax=Salinibacterium sp. ZJ454 TaxID=2708339 RepID=UPI00141E9DF8|nr:flavin reductase family protein [Salinibacterium sp. ZJ454]